MAAVICNLRGYEIRTLISWPCFVLQIASSFSTLTTPLPEGFDDPGSVLKVVPAPSGIEEAHLLLVVAQELAKTSIVEQK